MLLILTDMVMPIISRKFCLKAYTKMPFLVTTGAIKIPDGNTPMKAHYETMQYLNFYVPLICYRVLFLSILFQSFNFPIV